ncbi:MAG: hypothetical protein HY868_00180 [Chloroflexi bacterium]|nr:hypothetical protein [Chloroflexota bacterium]
MTLTRKPTKRTVRRATRKPRATLTTRQAIVRIDAMMRELQVMRRELTLPKAKATTSITNELFGALGKGTMDEYDMDLDWKRFSEWHTR